MRAILGALALAALAAPADAAIVHSNDAGNPYNHHRAMLKREITTDASQATSQSWDFIIAGGGLAGLAVAARLSEWSNTTVLVIEAGTDGSSVEEQIDIPGYSYLNSLTGSAEDWQYTTVAQTSAGNSTKSWPRGKVLGGSGAINGMFWGRGSKEDYDAWATLNPNGTQTWNWEEVNKYIMKAENFGAPSDTLQTEFSMPINESAHGQSGPIHTGMSSFIYPAVANWVPGWTSLGFTAHDLAAGTVRGVTITPSTMYASNSSRCDSKAGYIDASPPRSNLVILTGQQVTKVNFNGTDSSGNQVASGVTFAASNGAQEYTVTANKEVILCGGTIGSAQLLQVSGIGPKSVLESVGVTVLKDLPVGYNLQDHVSNSMYFTIQDGVDTWTAFNNNATAKADALTEWRDNKTGQWTYVNEAVGYVSMADIVGGDSAASSAANALDLSSIVTQVANAHGYPSNVQQGLAKQYAIQQEFLTSDNGQLEIILTMLGGTDAPVGIQVAVQHPFSRGTLLINSDSAWDYPTINPDYLSIDIDNTIAVGGFNFARKVAATTDMAKLMKAEAYTAGQDNTTLLATYKSGAGTEYHPCATCSMLPEDDGGVVDTNLLVYGTKNVRVIDASIIPLHVSAHLMATTYGIAEKGADIIKAAYVYVPPVASSTSASASSTASSSATASADASASSGSDVDASNSTADSSVLSSGAKLGIGIGVGVGVAALIAAIIAFACIKRNRNARSAGDEKGWYAGAGGADQGAWDANAAYNEQQGYPMGRPQRPFSTDANSINTMATADLQTTPRADASHLPPSDSGYNIGDYANGGTGSYRDYPEPEYGGGHYQAR